MRITIIVRGLFKLAFHGADTDTDTDADILADLSDTPAFPCEDVRYGCARAHV